MAPCIFMRSFRIRGSRFRLSCRGHREVGLANAEVDRLGSNEDQGLPVFAERLQGVQQDRPGHRIEFIPFRHATPLRYAASIRSVLPPPKVHVPGC